MSDIYNDSVNGIYNDIVNKNGAISNKTSYSPMLDLFYHSVRGLTRERLFKYMNDTSNDVSSSVADNKIINNDVGKTNLVETAYNVVIDNLREVTFSDNSGNTFKKIEIKIDNSTQNI